MSAQLTHEATQAKTTQLTAADGPGRNSLRSAWRRVRLTVAEMNHATRRLVELQAPWTVDEQWHSR
jgi:mannosyltransferase OCH1-like enzyme